VTTWSEVKHVISRVGRREQRWQATSGIIIGIDCPWSKFTANNTDIVWLVQWWKKESWFFVLTWLRSDWDSGKSNSIAMSHSVKSLCARLCESPTMHIEDFWSHSLQCEGDGVCVCVWFWSLKVCRAMRLSMCRHVLMACITRLTSFKSVLWHYR